MFTNCDSHSYEKHRLVFQHSYSSSYTVHHQTTSVVVVRGTQVQKEVQAAMHAVQHSKATFHTQEHILTYLLVNNNIKNDFLYDQRICLSQT